MNIIHSSLLKLIKSSLFQIIIKKRKSMIVSSLISTICIQDISKMDYWLTGDF